MIRDRRFATTTAFALLVHAALVLAIAAAQQARPSEPQAMWVSVSVQRDLAVHEDRPELLLAVHQDSSPAASSHARGSNPQRQIVGRKGSGGRGVPAQALIVGRVDSASSVAGPVHQDRSDGPGEVNADADDEAKTRRESRLTLEQLGIGRIAEIPREESPLLRDSKRRLAESRKLQLSLLQQATVDAARIGLGPASPILGELEQLVQQSPLAANGWANVHARLLESGAIEIELLSSSTERERWTRILASAQQHLAIRRLQPPKGSRGLDLEIHVESRVVLSSGHDPGFAVKLFGMTLKKGEGKRSSGVELLSSLPHVELPDDEGPTPSADPVPKTPRLVLDLFKLGGDPSDIGAKPRRMVSARVTRQTVL
jgi:hypothetical protein